MKKTYLRKIAKKVKKIMIFSQYLMVMAEKEKKPLVPFKTTYYNIQNLKKVKLTK